MEQVEQAAPPRPAKSPDAFSTISEVAEKLDVPQHVLRFWETKFPQVKPLKRGGGRRYYRPDDVELLTAIRSLLYGHGYTIRGVQKLFKEQGQKSVLALGAGQKPQPRPDAAPVEAPVQADPLRLVAAPAPAAAAPVNLAAAAVIEGAIADLAEVRDFLLKIAG